MCLAWRNNRQESCIASASASTSCTRIHSLSPLSTFRDRSYGWNGDGGLAWQRDVLVLRVESMEKSETLAAAPAVSDSMFSVRRQSLWCCRNMTTYLHWAAWRLQLITFCTIGSIFAFLKNEWMDEMLSTCAFRVVKHRDQIALKLGKNWRANNVYKWPTSTITVPHNTYHPRWKPRNRQSTILEFQREASLEIFADLHQLVYLRVNGRNPASKILRSHSGA